MENRLTSSVNAKVVSGALAIFASFGFLYASLRSKDVFGTDGAHRCLEVFHRQTIFFHENSHLLYPVNVLVWTRLAALLGLKPNGPLEFYSTVELMNCFAAAASLATIFLLTYMAVSSWQFSLGAVIALGVSKAFFVQATNANEAVVGLFWSLAAMLILVVGLSARSTWLLFVSGLLFSLSMASYESMIFLAPAGLVLIWQFRSREERKPFLSKPVLAGEGAFLFGCAAAWLGIHAWADWMTGNTNPAGMAKQLFSMPDAGSYLGLGFGRWPNMPIGLVRNIYPLLPQFDGMRHVLTGPKTSLLGLLLVLAFFASFFFYCGIYLWSRRKELDEPSKIGLLAGLTGLLFTLVPLLIWDPQYEKLWLQPLAILVFLIAIALKTPATPGGKSPLILRIVPAALVAAMCANLPSVVSSHRTDVTPYFRDAEDVSQKVRPGDLVVGDWEKVAILYGEVWARENQYIDFVSEAVFYGRGATERLREDVLATERRGGHVYFLGLVGRTESEWNAFLGTRCGVPMSDFEPYRKHSIVVRTYRDGPRSIALWQLDPLFSG